MRLRSLPILNSKIGSIVSVGIGVGKFSKFCQNRHKLEKTKNFNLQLNLYIIEFEKVRKPSTQLFYEKNER